MFDEEPEVPDNEAGIHKVSVEENDRTLSVTVFFYDTRDLKHEQLWVPQRLIDINWKGIDEDPTPEDVVTDVHHVEGDIYRISRIVAKTPTTRGLVEELQDFDEWSEKPMSGKGSYLTTLLHCLGVLWD